MGQAISTIKAATTALETCAAFLEQAVAVANQALENISKTNAGSSVEGPSEEVDDLSLYTHVSTAEELAEALADDSVNKILLMEDIRAKGGRLTIGSGKEIRGSSSDIRLYATKGITLAEDAILRDISIGSSPNRSQSFLTGGILEGIVNVTYTGANSGREATAVQDSIVSGVLNIEINPRGTNALKKCCC